MNDTATQQSKLSDSKIYALSRQEPLLKFLVPDLPTQIGVETEIDEIFKRTDDDGDDTRILINYRNNKGSSILNQILDHERLDRSFGIDGFMDGLMRSVQDDPQSVDVSVETINNALLTALTTGAVAVLDLDGNDQNKAASAVAEKVLQSLTAILFNDSLDVMIALQEKPAEEGQSNGDVVIAAMWAVKQRKCQTPVAEETPTVH